jgi:hypothetical protein
MQAEESAYIIVLDSKQCRTHQILIDIISSHWVTGGDKGLLGLENGSFRGPKRPLCNLPKVQILLDVYSPPNPHYSHGANLSDSPNASLLMATLA